MPASKIKGQCAANTQNTIEMDLNRGVNLIGPIRRQDTKVGGRHIAFSPFCTGARAVENVTTFEFSPRLNCLS